jgi:hypothetical protein
MLALYDTSANEKKTIFTEKQFFFRCVIKEHHIRVGPLLTFFEPVE